MKVIWYFKWIFIDYIVTPVGGEKCVKMCLWIIQEIRLKDAD